MPVRNAIHTVVDNYAIHNFPKGYSGLPGIPAERSISPQIRHHSLISVERFFGKLTKRPLKRGVFLSVVDLHAAINR